MVSQPRLQNHYLASKNQRALHWNTFAETDGTLSDNPHPKGMLIYTRDGRMSDQLLHPTSAGSLSNQYIEDGCEASFETGLCHFQLIRTDPALARKQMSTEEAADY